MGFHSRKNEKEIEIWKAERGCTCQKGVDSPWSEVCYLVFQTFFFPLDVIVANKWRKFKETYFGVKMKWVRNLNIIWSTRMLFSHQTVIEVWGSRCYWFLKKHYLGDECGNMWLKRMHSGVGWLIQSTVLLWG